MTLNQISNQNEGNSAATISKGISMFQPHKIGHQDLIDEEILDLNHYQKQQSQNLTATKEIKSRFGEELTQNGEISQFRVPQLREISDFDMYTDYEHNQTNNAKAKVNIH